jgi:hypothetical protein
VPGGARVARVCESCGEESTFYEKDRTSTFRLYFIDVFDYRKNRVMECGACGAQYATDELGTSNVDLPTSIGKKLEEGGEAIGRFATSLGERIHRFATDATDRPAAEDAEPPAREFKRPPPDADLSEDDLAALDDLETKFRALEREEERRRRR